MPYKFDRDIFVERMGENRFEATISGDWSILAPNGGYLLAIAGNVIRSISDYPIPLSMTAYYHKPTSIGYAELIVDQVIRNKRTFTANLSMIQKEKVVSSYTGMFTREDAFGGRTLVSEQPYLPNPSECIEFPDPPFSFFNQIKLIVPPGQLEWLQGIEGKETVFTGHFSFQDNRPMDALAVLLFIDATPPPILRAAGPLAWVPTLELSAQIRNIPTGKSLGFISRTRFTTNGLTETDVELWTDKGTIIAISRQLAFIKERI